MREQGLRSPGGRDQFRPTNVEKDVWGGREANRGAGPRGLFQVAPQAHARYWRVQRRGPIPANLVWRSGTTTSPPSPILDGHEGLPACGSRGAPDVQPAGLRVPSSTGRARCKARSSHLAQARLFWTPWKLGVAKSPGDAPRRAAPAPPPSPEPSPAQPHVAGERAWPRAPLPAARPRPGAAPPPRSVY